MRILIAGGGQSAALIAGRLIREGNEVTIVDRDAERCAQLEDQLDAKVVRAAVSAARLSRSSITALPSASSSETGAAFRAR